MTKVPQDQGGQMSSMEFAVFFNELFAMASDPDRDKVSPLEVMEKYDIQIELPPSISARVMPLLQSTRASVPSVRASECGACGACGACAACGGLNFGVPGAAAAAIWAIAVQPVLPK